MSVFLGTACEVVRRSCWRKDNGPMLGVRLLPVFGPQQAFIRNSLSLELSTLKSSFQIKLHNVNETSGLVVQTDTSWLCMINV